MQNFTQSIRICFCCFALFGFALPAAAVVVPGTALNDSIRVGEVWILTGGSWVSQGVHSYVNGSFSSLSVSSGDTIEINGLAGDDYLEVMRGTFAIGSSIQLRKITILSSYNTIIDGGAGDDEIHGSNTRDIIFGGTGSDDIFGYDGADYIIGSSAQCANTGGVCGVSCMSGSDSCEGGSGNDAVVCDLSADGGGGDDGCFFVGSSANCEVSTCF